MTITETAKALERLRNLYSNGDRATEGMVTEWHRHLEGYTADQVHDAITQTIATWPMTILPPISAVLKNLPACKGAIAPNPDRVLWAAMLRKEYAELKEADKAVVPRKRYERLLEIDPSELEENGKRHILEIWGESLTGGGTER